MALVLADAFPYYSITKETTANDIISHMFFHAGTIQVSNINIVYWSLGVELKFYLLAPFVLIFCWSLRTIRTMAQSLCTHHHYYFFGPTLTLFFIYTSPEGIKDYYEFFRALRSPFHANIDGLFFGVLLAFLYKQIQPHIGTTSKEWKIRTQFLLVSFSCGTIFFLMSHDFHAELTFFDAVFQTFLLSLLFFGVALSGLCCLDTYRAGPVSRLGSQNYLTRFIWSIGLLFHFA